jgi:RNA polymerase sigma factor (sigma-70 family)
MSESPFAAIVGRLVRGLPPTDGTADAALLARFIGWRDEAAFELLVYRHGPMVRGLCRRILRHEQDAEDAFQATFLALAKKAATIRGQALAGWLYRVACHAALKARARSARFDSTLPDVASAAAGAAEDFHERELRRVLDEEVLRLPERFRLPVVLCYLQGRSNREAAVTLGIPKGTVDSRLATARQRLRDRLVRRGIAPAVGAAAIDRVLDSVADAAELPGSVARALAKSAVAFVSNQSAAGVVPVAAAGLAEGVLQTMFVTKIKWAMACVLTLAVLGSGAGVATYEAAAGGQPPAVADKQKEPPPKAPAEPSPEKQNPAPTHRKPVVDDFAKLCELLQQPISLDRETPAAPLKDILDFLSDKYNTTFVVDVQAFEHAGVGGGRNVQDTQVSLQKMPDATLSAALRFLLAQVGGTYLIRGQYIEITTRDRQALEAFGPASGLAFEFLPPTVNVVFRERLLEKALADLAGQTGKNVVLDPRVQDKEKLTVSARLLNTPVESAVLVLADMVGLQPVTIDNVYYVTTKENAERLRLRQESLKPAPVAPVAKPVPAK